MRFHLICRPDVPLQRWHRNEFWKEYTNIGSSTKMQEFIDGNDENIPRVHYKDLSYDQFVENYMRPNLPVIIEGLADDWPAMEKWTFKQLYKDYGDVEFMIGEDDIGTPINVTMKEYIQYMIVNKDDSPHYLFHKNLHRNEDTRSLQNDYTPPIYFDQDYQG